VGTGTVTSVGSGTGLTGGPITGSGTLSINTAVVPLLVAPNNFTGNQTVNGNLSATGLLSASGLQIGGNLFDYGSLANLNAFLGFAGDPNGVTGTANVGVGPYALDHNSTGTDNTAVGAEALPQSNSSNNTAIGFFAGVTLDGSPMTGGNNTFVGWAAGAQTGTLTNATAIGYGAQVSVSNALVLGGSGVDVGIGTSAPTYALEVYSSGATVAQMAMVSSGTDAAFSLKNTASGGREYWIDSGSGSAGVGAGNFAVHDRTAGATRLAINQNGQVGIGTTAPDNTLSVNGSADKPGGGSWGTYSDGRLKNLNGSFNSGLSQVLKLNPVRYRYKADNAMGIRDTDEHIGVVAQDVQRVIPEAVTENSKGYLLVNNDPIIWSMLNAIKEQQGEIQHEQAANNEQQTEFRQEQAELAKALRQIRQQQSLLRTQSAAMRSLEVEVRETRETLRKVKAQIAASQRTVLARK